MSFRTLFQKIIAVCLAVALSVTLVMYSPKDHLGGEWRKVNGGECDALCTFIIEEDRITGKLTLTFDNDKDLTEKPVSWVLNHFERKGYHLILENGDNLEFTVRDGKLVMRDGDVYEKQ